MPTQTQTAINWALTQTYVDSIGNTHAITKDDAAHLVDKVREYFNNNKISYATFSYADLQPYL